MQAEQLTSNLSRHSIRTEEFVFSSAGAIKLARSIFNALRDRALELPDDPEVRSEFIATRLVETGPGTVKLQNPPGAHDDIVTAVGMVVADLLDRADAGRGSIMVPVGRVERGRIKGAGRPTLPPHLAARQAARRGPKLPRGAIRTANDPQAAAERGVGWR